MRSLRESVGRRLVALVVPGAFVLGTSCAENVRDSVIGGSLGFVEDTATSILEQWFPADAFAPAGD